MTNARAYNSATLAKEHQVNYKKFKQEQPFLKIIKQGNYNECVCTYKRSLSLSVAPTFGVLQTPLRSARIYHQTHLALTAETTQR